MLEDAWRLDAEDHPRREKSREDDLARRDPRPAANKTQPHGEERLGEDEGERIAQREVRQTGKVEQQSGRPYERLRRAQRPHPPRDRPLPLVDEAGDDDAEENGLDDGADDEELEGVDGEVLDAEVGRGEEEAGEEGEEDAGAPFAVAGPVAAAAVWDLYENSAVVKFVKGCGTVKCACRLYSTLQYAP